MAACDIWKMLFLNIIFISLLILCLTLQEMNWKAVEEISHGGAKNTKKRLTEPSLPCWLFIVHQPTGIQFLHHQWKELWRTLSLKLLDDGKTRPVEGRSVAQHRGGTRTPTLTPILGGTTESTSQMASKSSHIVGGKQRPSESAA